MLKFNAWDKNNDEYQHWSYYTKFIGVTINKRINEKYELSIHPNVDKGYRDPYETKQFDSFDECVNFATDFLKEE